MLQKVLGLLRRAKSKVIFCDNKLGVCLILNVHWFFFAQCINALLMQEKTIKV